MFVGIDDFKGAIAIENILTPYKKGRLADDKKTRLPKEKITPQVCMEVLQSTNYARNIKDMLQCIEELPTSEQAQFKDVVLATFTQREQPQAILDLGQKLAETSGFVGELEEAKKLNEGEYLLSKSNLSKIFVSFQDAFSNQDFRGYDKLVCMTEEKIDFSKNVKLPPSVDVSRSSEVNLTRCNLSKLDDLHFKEGAAVKLYLAKGLPKNLDVSMCAEVDLSGCDLMEMDNLCFKEGAKVNFGSAKNLPQNLDVSNCSEVKLFWCNLIGISSLTFKEGAEVDLSGAQHLPQCLDFSRCSKMDLEGCDFSDTKKLVFKSRQQMQDSSARLPDDWKGELIFADEQHELDLSLAMAAKTKGGR